MQAQPQASPRQTFHAPEPLLPDDEPFRVSFTGSGIEVTARLTDVASAEHMIRSIEALKLLLKPAREIKKPDQVSDGDDDPDFLK